MPTVYDRNALILRAIAREQSLPCIHCGHGIDWTARSRSRWSFSADHIHPKSLGGTDDLWNLQVSHYGCNAARGNGVTRGLGSHNGLSPESVTQHRTRRLPPPQHQPQSETWP